MSKREPLRIRLSKSHTIPEIEKMILDVENDPDSKTGETGGWFGSMYNKTVSKKMDEMSWAIYIIAKKRDGIK